MSYRKPTLYISSLFAFFLLAISCSATKITHTTFSKSTLNTQVKYKQQAPNFDEDSAYSFVEKQVSFGSRVPNTAAHIACGNYLVKKLKNYGADVIEQKVKLQTYDGISLDARNIIGVYNPANEKRVLLYAHWDSRPFADHDKNKYKRSQPIDGANDGASGVGVLLEIARHLKNYPINIGIDIIFFDAEDWGQPIYENNYVEGDWYCLGSQYWANNPHIPNYSAQYGILLDMVGAKDATFYREGYSDEYASDIVDKIWHTASLIGCDHYFIDESGGYIIDDNFYVNKLNGTPSVNIIYYSTETSHGFGDFWHTHNDNINVIDKATLKAVGQTVMEVLYTEK